MPPVTPAAGAHERAPELGSAPRARPPTPCRVTVATAEACEGETPGRELARGSKWPCQPGEAKAAAALLGVEWLGVDKHLAVMATVVPQDLQAAQAHFEAGAQAAAGDPEYAQVRPWGLVGVNVAHQTFTGVLLQRFIDSLILPRNHQASSATAILGRIAVTTCAHLAPGSRAVVECSSTLGLS